MILGFVQVCYNSIHQPFASEGAVKIQNLNSERPALKIVRAVLRDSGIDAEDAVSYSIHRCYCEFKITIEKEDGEESFNSGLTLDELEIKDGDCVFIRKMDSRVNEMQVISEQTSTLKRSSRKRKEGTEDEKLQSEIQTISQGVETTSEKTESTSEPSKGSAAVEKVSSNLENLSSNAAIASKSISTLLDGDGWKSQSIGTLGTIKTRNHKPLKVLCRLVKTSLEVPQLSKSEPSGLFNSDLVEALTRAYHQRVDSSMRGRGHRYFFVLGLSDYEKANELLKGKIEQDGSWERSSLAHLDGSALSKPEVRFPLSDSGLTGQNLNTARAICILWKNGKWIDQALLPGLSPISLKEHSRNAIIRQIAELTRVKPGETIPDGFPPIVLRALQEAIKQRESSSDAIFGAGSIHGWVQSKDIPKALEILKNKLEEAQMTQSTSIDNRPNKKMKIDSLLNPELL